jgi:hypothetical protein
VLVEGRSVIDTIQGPIVLDLTYRLRHPILTIENPIKYSRDKLALPSRPT